MADVTELLITEATEDELWNHGLTVADAISVLDEGRFRTFRNPRHERRRYLIGPTAGGELLTLVIQPVGDGGHAVLVTGWRADDGERTLYSRPGGTRHVGG